MIETTHGRHQVDDVSREDLVTFLSEDLANEMIARYRQRVLQCEQLDEYALGEQVREILVDEQDHPVALATALGVDIPDAMVPGEQPFSCVRQIQASRT